MTSTISLESGVQWQPYIVINDMPKVENLKKQLPALYKEK